MIDIVADLHVHTVASGHAMGTLREMEQEARRLGYRAMAVTDHGPAMPGVAHRYYFTNLRNLPPRLDGGFLLLKGVEANILDDSGRLDMEGADLARFDWVIASCHKVLLPPMTFEQATGMWLRVAQNPHVDMIGHSEEGAYRYDYDRVAGAFARQGKVVELNAASAVTRPGNGENQRLLAQSCMQNGTRIAVNSDAHSTYGMDVLGGVLEMLGALGFPEELVVNSSMDRLLAELERHGITLAG